MTPIVWIYADADMSQQCPNCQAAPNEYCRRADGQVRSVPCIRRMSVDPRALHEASNDVERNQP